DTYANTLRSLRWITSFPCPQPHGLRTGNVQNVAPARSEEDDEAFIAQFKKVRNKMEPPSQDLLGGSAVNTDAD
ncbi:hypothetical protein OAV21_01195, partial [bacterium]|nr:hypothetical protein [bacterium]